MRPASPLYGFRTRRRRRGRSALYSIAAGGAAVGLVALLVGLAFSGSPGELAAGTRIAGVEVGGMSRSEAVTTLERRFAAVDARPVTFVAGDASFEFSADQLAIEPDWRSAVAAAARTSDGFGPVRGFKRLRTRVFGAEVQPPLRVSDDALEFVLGKLAAEVDLESNDAALVRRGLRIEVVPQRAGRRLQRGRAGQIIVRSLGSIQRAGRPVKLPVSRSAPSVTTDMLARAARGARTAVSAPVHLRGDGRSWRLPRWRVAELLVLPSGGATRLAIGGPEASAYFSALSRRVGQSPVDAEFAVSYDRVRIIPSREGTELDVPATARRLLRAATSTVNRTANLVVARAEPDRTTAEARAMGIDRRMGGYKTYNAGDSNRITNLRLGVTLLDGTLVPPGGTFSLNDAIGERTIERGFRPAPVIIGTEYAEEVGGGTSQVATTAFNAAWEAGLEITERNPHSLYISRYPLGRDATVYWPSLDLKFVNDTQRWVLVKGFAEWDGISVAIYGGERRRVESSEGTMTITGPVPVERVEDPTLPSGRTVVEAEGSRPSRTTVTRMIYDSEGALLDTETWNTSYKGETRVVRVGTKVAKPKTKPPADEPKPPTDEAPTTPSPTQPTRP